MPMQKKERTWSWNDLVRCLRIKKRYRLSGREGFHLESGWKVSKVPSSKKTRISVIFRCGLSIYFTDSRTTVVWGGIEVVTCEGVEKRSCCWPPAQKRPTCCLCWPTGKSRLSFPSPFWSCIPTAIASSTGVRLMFPAAMKIYKHAPKPAKGRQGRAFLAALLRPYILPTEKPKFSYEL